MTAPAAAALLEGPRFAYRDACGRTCSEGRRLLNVIADATKRLAIAAALGCSERHVGRLVNGQREPSPEMIARIFVTFGIRGEAWGLAPEGDSGSDLVGQREPERDDDAGRTDSESTPQHAAE